MKTDPVLSTYLTRQDGTDLLSDHKGAFCGNSGNYDPEALNNMGQTCYFQHKFDKAITFYEQAIGLNPRDFVVLNNIANSYVGLQDREKAIEYYRKALEINPNYRAARLNLEMILK